MMLKNNVIKIFYAWQNDLPPKFNRYAIKKALGVATTDLEQELSSKWDRTVSIDIDDATRGLPGSPHIPTAILEKIQIADIFIADVSIVNFSSKNESKGAPNPNVIFELGYAVSYLGWDRVLLLLNEHHGPVECLPFDIDRQRASPFKLAEGGIGSQTSLEQMLKTAVLLILEKDPARPRKLDIGETQRTRDLDVLKWVLGFVHWPTIDEHIAAGPKYVSMASVVLSDQIVEVAASSTFHLYDKKLKYVVLNFIGCWKDSMKYDHYIPMLGQRSYIFKPGDPSQRVREQSEFKYMEEKRRDLFKAKNRLLDILRKNYPELHVQELSDEAGARYDADMTDTEEKITAKPFGANPASEPMSGS